MFWILNGTLHPMEQTEIITDGCIGIENKKIKYIGKRTEFAKLMNHESDRILDVQHGFIMPGIIEAHCHIGLSEEKKGMEGDDCNDCTDPVTPYLRAIDGINPLDPAFHLAISAGITSVMAGPGSANVVGGQFAFLKTHGRSIKDMIVKAPAALKVALGENPKREYGTQGKMPSTRMGVAALLREQLFLAKQYQLQKKNALQAGDTFTDDFRLEPWLPVLEHQIPIKAHAHRTDDIQTAIRIAKEFNVNLTLDHCTEGHLIKDEIVASGFPAICGPHLSNRNKLELQNADFKTPGILSNAGVLVAITTDHPVSLIQYLPICAGLAMKKGMPKSDALKAITINPAQICGVADRVGSLAVGKDADIAIFSKCPLEISSTTLYTIIDGDIIYDYKDNS